MKKFTKPVLAEGESTGHAHVLDGDVDVFEHDDGVREFSLKEKTPLKHEEHGEIVLPADDFLSDKVNEYDHFAEEARKVTD